MTPRKSLNSTTTTSDVDNNGITALCSVDRNDEEQNKNETQVPQHLPKQSSREFLIEVIDEAISIANETRFEEQQHPPSPPSN